MKPFLSIITCTRNRKKEISKLISSLKKQKLKNFQWIIGDDNSTDGTYDLIMKQEKNFKSKIVYIKSSHRIGLSVMQNKLMKYVKSEYFVVCDSDDYFKRNSFRKIYSLTRFIKHKKVIGILSANLDQFGNNQLFYRKFIPNKSLIIKWKNILHQSYGDGTLILKTELFKNKKILEVDFYIPLSSYYLNFYDKNLYVTHEIFKIMERNTSNSISSSKTLNYNRGNAYSFAIHENKEIFFSRSFKQRIKLLINYFRHCRHGEIELKKSLSLLNFKINSIQLKLIVLTSKIIILYDIFTKNIKKSHIEFNKNRKIVKFKKLNLY